MQTIELALSDVSVQYQNGTSALKNASIAFPKGEFVGLIGKSGAGKSTFLRCINRLVSPTTGQVSLDGRDLSRMAIRAVRSDIAFLFQRLNLLSRLSVLNNVLIGRLGRKPAAFPLTGYFSVDDKRIAFESLDKVGILHLAFKRCDELSGGEQQRVAIARALAQKARIVLADEPVASLDPANAHKVMQLFQQINRSERVTVIVSLHHLELATQYTERIIGFKAGEIVLDRPPGGQHFSKSDYENVYE